MAAGPIVSTVGKQRERKAATQLIFYSVWDLSLLNSAPTLRVGLPTSVNLI